MSEEPRLLDDWRDIQARHARINCALEHVLSEHDLGVSEYEVLERLATTSQSGCRMQDLSEVVHLSQSALSRVVGRLEKDGLVERAMCSEDRRGIYAKLTPAGKARYKKAKPAHRRVLAEQLSPAA